MREREREWQMVTKKRNAQNARSTYMIRIKVTFREGRGCYHTLWFGLVKDFQIVFSVLWVGGLLALVHVL